jgi:GxxExxY protein
MLQTAPVSLSFAPRRHEGTKDFTKGEKLEFDELSNKVIGCAIEVHKALGPGLLESAYKQCLAREIQLGGFQVELELPLPLEYKGLKLETAYRLDMLVERKLLVEVKSVELLLPIHQSQLLTYLKLTDIKVGLLLNFNVQRLKNGMKRMVL